MTTAASATSTAMSEYKLGQTVETNDGRQGVVKYVGDIHVADGLFLGIVLSSPTGKNDGSVQNQRYFTCAPFHGLFVRPAAIVQIISQPQPLKPAPAPTRVAPAASKVGSRPLSKAVAPTERVRASSVTAPRASPTKAFASKRVSTISTATNQKPPVLRRLSQAIPPAAPRTGPPTTRPIPPTNQASATTARQRENNVDALETKIRHLEKQHVEDREQMKSLQQDKSDKERFEGIIQKLQGKCQTLHQENGDLKDTLKELETLNEQMLKSAQAHETDLEIAFLDKEMAEERAEQAEADLESLRSRLEERELELEILRDEANLLTEDMSEDDKQSANYFRLQHERDRLREALLKLKEITEESEADYKARIRELERDAANFEELREEYSTLKERTLNADATIDDLRQQLDAANEWEEMIEDLSDQNQQFKEKIAEKDLAIKDLESIKELSDELELQHIEQANDLRAELEAKDFDLAEQSQKLAQQDAQIADQELLITKFRDLVLDLQSKMTDAEASKTMSEEQAKDVTGRFNEVMELNRRLHGATLNTTIKTIAAELQTLQANEAEEELHIMKHYLPEPSEVYMNESLRSYFRAKRVTSKAKLTKTLLYTYEMYSRSTDKAEHPLNDIYRFSGVHDLTRLQLRSEQFSAAVPSSSLEEYAEFSNAEGELIPIEKHLERVLDALKKDDIRMKEAAELAQCCDKVIRGLVYDFKKILDTRPENELIFRASSIKSGLRFAKAILDTFMSWMINNGIAEPDTDDEAFAERTAQLGNAVTESITAFDKFTKTLRVLKEDNLYPQFPSGVAELIDYEESVSEKVQSVHLSALELARAISQRTENEGPALGAVQGPLFTFLQTLETLNIADMSSKATSWNEHASLLINNIEVEQLPAPWVLKAKEIEMAKQHSVEAQKRLSALMVEHHATLVQIREKEEIIETKDLEVEHLRAKYREAVQKTEDASKLQIELALVMEEKLRVETVVNVQKAEIQKLKDDAVAAVDRELSEKAPAVSEKPAEKAPEPMGSVRHSSGFITFMNALTNENHWLRRRQNSRMLDYNLRAMFAKMRMAQGPGGRTGRADKLLAMSLAMDESPRPETPNEGGYGWDMEELEDSDWTPDAKSTPRLRGLVKMGTPPTLNRSPRGRSPLVLSPINTRLAREQQLSPTPSTMFSGLEDESFLDLSPVAEEFGAEMMETSDGSFLNHSLDTIAEASFEGFSVVGEVPYLAWRS